MEGQTEGKATFPPFAQRLIERGFREGKLDGLREGELKGKLDGLREALFRLVARAGVTLSEGDRARIQTCDDAATLDRWIENVLSAKTATDVLS